jgi:hypothetical protein
MSKMVQKSDSLKLPKHQHKIVMFLAKCRAMNISQTNKKIHGQNTSTTRAFHELEKKGLIAKIGAKNYRGRKFPEYWLSRRGLAYAFMNNERSKAIETFASLYLKNETIEMYLKMHSVLDKRTLKVQGRGVNNPMSQFDVELFFDGELDFEELAWKIIYNIDYLGDALLNYFKETEALEIFDAIKLPEELCSKFKGKLNGMNEFLDKIGKVEGK